MNKTKYLENDNELLYLIKNHDEEALELMFKKYENLILSKIRQYHFPISNKEDYLQEGRIVLLKAIDTYRTEFEKTFTKYFELLLINRFNTLYRINKKYEKHIVLVEVEKVDINNKKEDKRYDLKEVSADALSEFCVRKSPFSLYATRFGLETDSRITAKYSESRFTNSKLAIPSESVNEDRVSKESSVLSRSVRVATRPAESSAMPEIAP